MTPANPKDLQSVFNERYLTLQGPHQEMKTLLDVYDGGLPEEYLDYFPDDMHIHVLNQIRLAWDDLAGMAGKVFPLNVAPRGNSVEAKKRAEKVEQVGYGYNAAGSKVGAASFPYVMKKLAWWRIGVHDAVAIVRPSYEHKTPYFDFFDPRWHYPPVGWTPWSGAKLNGTLVAYQMSMDMLCARFPDKAKTLAMNHKQYFTDQWMSRKSLESTWMWVGEYYHEDAWYLATLEDTPTVLLASESGDKDHPGVCPVVPFTGYGALRQKGRSIFADQISLQAALARMISQKIDYFDQTLYYNTYITGDVDIDHLDRGPGAINVIRPTGSGQARVDTTQPANPVDADQMIGMVTGLARMQNRNPEQFQGSGPAESAKALTELKEGIVGHIQDNVWPDFIEGGKKLYAAASRMDINLWGNEKKYANGKGGKNSVFEIDYTPNVHLKGYEDCIELRPGIGLAGYAGKIQMLQYLSAGVISRDTFFENSPEYDEPQEEKRRIQADKLEDTIWALLTAKAQTGEVSLAAMAELKNRVQGKDEDLFDAIGAMEAEGKLSVQQMMPEAGPAGPGGGALPPELMEAMGESLQAGGMPANLPSPGRIRGAA